MFGVRKSPEKRKHLRGLLRASAYFAVVGVVTGAFQLRHARAEMQNHTLALGRQMLQLSNGIPGEHDVHKAMVNGQPMWIGSTLTTDTVAQVLDRYEAHCTANLAQSAEAWREIAKSAAESPDKAGLFDHLGVLRTGNAREGNVTCFTGGSQSKPTVTEALSAFSETGELGMLGNLRYAYAKTSKNGTVVLTAWTDNAFNVAQFAPQKENDAAGSDFGEVPRPPNSRRVFTAALEGTPFGVNVYGTSLPPPDVIAFYDRELAKTGWQAIDPEAEPYMDEKMKAHDTVVRLYTRDAVSVTLSAHRDEGRTVAALGLAGVDGSERLERGSSF